MKYAIYHMAKILKICLNFFFLEGKVTHSGAQKASLVMLWGTICGTKDRTWQAAMNKASVSPLCYLSDQGFHKH